MGKVLVVGASGQLGSAVIDRLLELGQECVAFVRPSSAYTPPASGKVTVARGDLADLPSVWRACAGVRGVIATANSIVPRRGDPSGDEVEQYRNLTTACRLQGVKHLVFISAFTSPSDAQVPEFCVKRRVERHIMESGIPFTIFRGAAFMDIYYAVMGSRLALAGVRRPTLLRGFWLARWYARMSAGLMEDHGLALLPGDGRSRHAFICIVDVAAFLVRALELPAARNRCIELGGPEVLSWQEVADIFAEVLGRRIRRLALPGALLQTLRMALRVFSPAGENILASLHLLGRQDVAVEMRALCAEFSLDLTDTRKFLQSRLRQEAPPAAPGARLISAANPGEMAPPTE